MLAFFEAIIMETHLRLNFERISADARALVVAGKVSKSAAREGLLTMLQEARRTRPYLDERELLPIRKLIAEIGNS
jgi:hypothetical protein